MSTKVKNTSFLMFIFLVILLICESAYYYPKLPERMATHYNMSNQADGWMSKGNFLITISAVYLLSAGLITLIALFVDKLPDSMLNLPNKEILLSPGRKEKTLSLISKFLIDISSLTVLLFIIINYFVFISNMTNPDHLSFNLLYLILAYAVLIIIRIFFFYSKFNKASL